MGSPAPLFLLSAPAVPVRGVAAADAGSARIQRSTVKLAVNLRRVYDFICRVQYMMKEAAACDHLTVIYQYEW